MLLWKFMRKKDFYIYSNAREIIGASILVLDKLIRLVVSVLALTVGQRKITLMHLHAVVVLNIHIVITEVRLTSLGRIFRRLPMICTVVVCCRSRSRHLRPMQTLAIRNWVLTAFIFVRVGTWCCCPLILWLIVWRCTATLRGYPVSLVCVLERVLVAHNSCVLGLLPSYEGTIGETSSPIYVLFSGHLRSVIRKRPVSLLGLMNRLVVVITVKQFLNTRPF